MKIELEKAEREVNRKKIFVHEPTPAIRCYLELSSTSPRPGSWHWLDSVTEDGDLLILTTGNYNAAANIYRKLQFVANKMTARAAQETAEHHHKLYEGWHELAALIGG